GENVLRKLRAHRLIVHLQGDFEVQPQASRVDVGRSDLRVRSVDDQELGMREGRRLQIDLYATLQQRRQPAARGPIHITQIAARRQHETYLHAAQRRGLQRRGELG